MKDEAELARRYLSLLKSSLLNELYLENDARMLYVFSRIAAGESIDASAVRDIADREPELLEFVRHAREEGRPWWSISLRSKADGQARIVNLRNLCEFTHTMVGRRRIDNVEQCLDVIRADNIPGDLIETGVWRGGVTVFMRGYLAAYGMEGRSVWVADSFAGLPKPSVAQDEGYDFSEEKVPVLAVSEEEVRSNFRRYGLLDDRVRFLKGWFRDSLPMAPVKQLALLRLDGDLYESTMDALNALYAKLEPGGFLIVDDYGDFQPCRCAVDEFRSRLGITDPIQQIDWAGIFWRKSSF